MEEALAKPPSKCQFKNELAWSQRLLEKLWRELGSISTKTSNSPLKTSCSLTLAQQKRRRTSREKKSSMSFSGFQRPGTRSSGRAFGISLSVDSAVSASGQAAAIDAASKPLSLTNHHPSTAAVSSAVAAAKNQLLFLVERHAVVVVQGEPNGGKADKVRSFCFLFLC